MKWLRLRTPDALLLLGIAACVFEGACRKWIFRGSAGPINYALYFAKDFIFAALVVFCRNHGVHPMQPSFKRVLIIGLPLILIGAAISAARELNLVGAVLSLRSLVLLPLLAYFALPRLAGIKFELVTFVIGGFTVLNAFLGFVQSSSPTDAAINFYANENITRAVAYEENVRAVGTFSYITGYANLATVGSWAGLVLLCLARGRLSYIAAGWGFYLAGLMCALVSISRGTVLTVLLLLGVLAISGKHPFSNLAKGVAALVVIVGFGYAFSLNPVVIKLTDTVIQRHETSDDTIEERTLDPLYQIEPAAEFAPMGIGFGSEQVAGVFADTGIMSFRRFEWQFPRLVLETGVIGLLGFFVTCAGTIYVMLKARRFAFDEGYRRICVLSTFLVGSFFYTNVAFNHVASFFAWIIVVVTLAALSATPLPRMRPNEMQYAGRMAGATS